MSADNQILGSDLLTAIRAQRDTALDTCAQLSAQINALKRMIEARDKEIAILRAPAIEGDDVKGDVLKAAALVSNAKATNGAAP